MRSMADKQVEKLSQGANLMAIAGLGFIAYGVVCFALNFLSTGFELGVETINGVTREQLNQINPAIVYYIGHLHIAAAGFIAATGIAVYALSRYGVSEGLFWAWVAAVIAPVVGLAAALPMHYFGFFAHDWVLHLGPIYVATAVFVIGALISLKGFAKMG